MPKLILSMDGLVLKEIVLNKERTSIGRKPVNDIQIDNLSISGQHAVITRILGDAFLEDLNSTNGTYVNGQPVKKYVLHNNDVIELGKYRIKYLVDVSPPGVAATELVDTATLKPFEIGTLNPAEPLPTGTSTIRTRNLQSQSLTGSAGGMSASVGHLLEHLGVIQVLSGINTGQELELSKPVTTLGKPGYQVAVITRREKGYFITHVEGKVYPQVNGEQLDAHAHKLNDHDIIEIAGVKMEFFTRS
ncbi:MAG: FHA domain-containing protein [Proteobacteria bacterium]|jgi:pSer/pThr/pTyr-binding forkhead associated (FHA) protein|nr:FHA domain-containing protein [Pseudomonadota bacterium]